MFNKKHTRIAAFIGTLGASATLIGASVAGTGAYFQDSTDTKTISGTMGDIQVAGVGGLDMVFENMLPGETHSKTVEYKNAGPNKEDVWLVFTDPDQLHGLNQLGTYGEVHVSSNGSEKFASKNLNDGYPCGTAGTGGDPTLCALPSKLKLADNVNPNQHQVFSFSFKPSEQFQHVQNLPILGLDYQLVATQHGIDPS